MLLHFAEATRNLGPLWVHSTFPFEDMNEWMDRRFIAWYKGPSKTGDAACICI